MMDNTGPTPLADYWMMQILTGHGTFQKFRCRIGKAADTKCQDCGAAVYDAEHVLVQCPEYGGPRNVLVEALGTEVDPTNIIGGGDR